MSSLSSNDFEIKMNRNSGANVSDLNVINDQTKLQKMKL